MTVGEVVRTSAEFLAAKGVPSPRVDAEHLVARGLGLSRLDLYLEYDRPLTGPELAACRELVRRRGTREPLAYVLGEWGFRRLTLKVDRRVLVPRPETEVVAGRSLELIRGLETPRVLDVGTGSGAIALAIADEHPGAQVTAVDVSADALAVARENVARTGLPVELEQRDVQDGLDGRYDLVVSNPPYVSHADIELLDPEVRDWEPRIATVGEEHTELVARAARDVLEPGGWLVVEIAATAGAQAARLLGGLGYEEVTVGPDLAGRDRVLEGRWPTTSRRR